jgi:hypothetical protein
VMKLSTPAMCTARCTCARLMVGSPTVMFSVTVPLNRSTVWGT